jgi:hypothetical protein
MTPGWHLVHRREADDAMSGAEFGPDNQRDAGDERAMHDHSPEEWAEVLARSIAHLAAQLTMTQIRLRAMATALEERGDLDAADIQQRAAAIATAETNRYLRENLGEALAEMIDIDSLGQDISSFFVGDG